MPSDKLYQVKVLDTAGQQQGEAVLLTSSQVDELLDELPDGWSTEEA